MKKYLDRGFCLLFFLMLLLPLVFTNFKKDQASALDNAYLPELDWDKTVPLDERVADMEEYLNKRVGFRETMLTSYLSLNDSLFGIMEHPLYMYGKAGHVFCKQDSYVGDFQHLNLDSEWADEFAASMQTFSDISHGFGAEFVYVLIPDKKTVYAEYFPDGINVYGDTSRTDQVLECLSHTDVDWYYAYDDMTAAKDKMLVNNLMYDAGHWNANGAFAAMQGLYGILSEKFPEVTPLTIDEFEVTTAHESSLQTSYFPIDEDVPVYTLRNSTAVDETDWLNEHLSLPFDDNYRGRYVNPAQADKPKLLVFHDSYLSREERYFTEHFSEVTFIHRYNILNPAEFAKYVAFFQPDIVIFENPERSFP